MDYYYGTICLEANRWAKDKPPVHKPVEWIDKIKAGKYSGVELWENHGKLLSTQELKQLRDAFPGRIIYNTYDKFTDETKENRTEAARIMTLLKAEGCKFNFGGETDRIDEYRRNFIQWSRNLPENMRFICECHAGTICETPEKANEILASLKDNRVEVLVHFKQDRESLKQWFDILGDRITHGHINYMRCEGDPWNDEKAVPFDFKSSLQLIGKQNLKTATLEFTQGTGEKDEDQQTQFDRALRDILHVKKEFEKIS